MDKQQTGLFALVADVGGTHIRFGILDRPDTQLQRVEVYDCADFAHLEDAVGHFLGQLPESGSGTGSPNILCLALPGDVQTEPVRLVNVPWTVDSSRIAAQFKCRVFTLNDFSAQALAIEDFTAVDLDWLRNPAGSPQGLNRAIIGPGTGLGVSALLPGGQVVESEGGHVSFAPQSELQQQLLTALWTLFPRLSAERLISGPGLANIYRGLALIGGQDRQLSPEQITEQALVGEPLCRRAVELFIEVFGSVCGDLALALGAKGGVYLSGGLLQGLGKLFDSMSFLEHFDNKGRYQDYCRQIPVARVLTPQPGLLGAARFARSQASEDW